MPAMASIVVKRSDGTTDITYDAQTGAGSDGSPAVWRQDTGNTATLPVGLRAFAWLKSMWNGPKTARKFVFHYEYPYALQDSATTKWSATDRVIIECTAIVPSNVPPGTINEATARGANLFASNLVKQSMQQGYAPNQ